MSNEPTNTPDVVSGTIYSLQKSGLIYLAWILVFVGGVLSFGLGGVPVGVLYISLLFLAAKHLFKL